MRDKLIVIWRIIVKIKILSPFVKFIRYFAATNFFNIILDFIEVKILHTSYFESKNYFKKNKKRIKDNVLCLEDKRSKMIYLSILAYRSTHNRKYLKRIVDKEQYFDRTLISFDKKGSEGFVDCGAYKGDTIKEYIKQRGKYACRDFIWAFEPDKYNCKCLKKSIRGLEKIKLYNIGTWSSATSLEFLNNIEEGCKITEEGNVKIKADTLDNLVGVQGEKVTYIKMDVEGSELETLKGAENIITCYKPRLAISIYHSDKDMIEIIEYIRKKYPFYKLYIRHYTQFYADTVLYAISK